MSKKNFIDVWDALYEDEGEAGCIRFRGYLLTFLRDYFKDNNLDKNKISIDLVISVDKANDLQSGKLSNFTTDDLIKYISRLGYEINTGELIKEAQ